MISAIMTATMSFVLLFEPAASETLEFVVEPPVGTIHLNPMQNITFQCRVNSIGHSYKPMWTLHYNDTDRFLSTHDDNDKDIIEEYGIHYYSGETVANITIPGTVENNRTEVWCTSLHSGVTEFSDSIEIIIAGHPLSPNPKLKVLSSSQLELRWDIPYTHEPYPVERYDIRILNTSSGHKMVDSITQNRYVYRAGEGNVQTKCDLLMFSVGAINELGQSIPGNVSGGFPIVPQPFPSEINVAVTFYGNGTPIAKVTFEAPFICDYQTSNLTITIKDITAVNVMPALVRQSTYNGHDRMITKTFHTGLLANHTYTMTIISSNDDFVEDVSTVGVNFSTTLHSALPTRHGLQVKDIALSAGGVFVVLLVTSTTIIIVMAIICSRKRKLGKAPGSTMDLMLNRSRAMGRMSGSQYDTPYKSSSSLYETIDSYQKHNFMPADKATTHMQGGKQQNIWKPQQYNFESKRSGDAVETETLYQEMHSACASEVKGHSPPYSHMMKPQNVAAPHNTSHPLKLHACQVELHAVPTAGGALGPFDAHLPQSESIGDRLSTVAVVNESQGRNGEGDQSEYTYMSQAGTLAGQQSKLTLCSNGCISPDHRNQDSSAHQ